MNVGVYTRPSRERRWGAAPKWALEPELGEQTAELLPNYVKYPKIHV